MKAASFIILRVYAPHQRALVTLVWVVTLDLGVPALKYIWV
jgi:hypothetical protein